MMRHIISHKKMVMFNTGAVFGSTTFVSELIEGLGCSNREIHVFFGAVSEKVLANAWRRVGDVK